MVISRNSAHEIAMTIIYDLLIYDEMQYDYDIKEVISDHLNQPFDEVDLYIKEVVVKSILHKEEIISLIEPELKKWKFNRLNHLAQAILLLSVAHFNYVKEVEKAVVIDVAVTLAKRYLDADDYKYINGVLDNVL